MELPLCLVAIVVARQLICVGAHVVREYDLLTTMYLGSFVGESPQLFTMQWCPVKYNENFLVIFCGDSLVI